MPDGATGYPETVLLRSIDSKGATNTEIDASEAGSGVMAGVESNRLCFVECEGREYFLEVCRQGWTGEGNQGVRV
jgi:hypothetical protein